MARERMIIGGLISIFLMAISINAWAAEKVKMGTALKVHAVFALPMLAIEEKGLWKKHGVEAEWIPFAAGGALKKAEAAGHVQVGIDGGVGTIFNQTAGLPLTIIYHLGVSNDFGIWVRADSPIKEPKDLRGKKVDVTQLGGSSHATARAVARSLGIEKEVRFMATGGIREQAAALKAGSIDSAMITFIAVAPLAVKKEIREVVAVRDYLPKDWVERVVDARRDFLERSPDAASRLTKAVWEATDFIIKNRAWAIEKMKTFSLYTPEAAEAIYPKLDFSKDGRMTRQAVANVIAFLVEYGVIAKEKAPRAEDLFTNKFIPSGG